MSRNSTIKTLYIEGASLAEIGRKFSISRQRVEQIVKNSKIKNYSGLIYFVRGNDLIKIGFTRNLEKRLQNLRNSSPCELQLLGTIPGSRSYEKELHSKFASCRKHSEWFMVTDELETFLSTVLETA